MDIFINKNIIFKSTIFKFKVCLGSCLFLWTLIESIRNENSGRRIWNDPVFSIFICMGNLLLLSWMWGLSIYVWKQCRIDYIRLLHLDSFPFFAEHSSSSSTSSATSVSPHQIIFDHTSTLSNIYFIFFILYTRSVHYVNHQQQQGRSNSGSLTYAHTLPLILIFIFGYYIFSPWKTKKQWFRLLFQVLLAPYYCIAFQDGYIGDILTSLVRVFIPLASSLLYLLMCLYSYLCNDFQYLSSPNRTPWWEKTIIFQFYLIPFFTLYPLWIRFMQCCRRSIETGENFPHHMNALKYASAMSVIAVGSFQPLVRRNSVWICALIAATVYQLVWDLTMDWGLITWSNSNNSSYRYQYQFSRDKNRMKSSLDSNSNNNDDDDDDSDNNNSNLFSRLLHFFHLQLRSTRLLHKQSRVYIAVIVFNTILRFAWTLTLLTYMYDTTNSSRSTTNNNTLLNNQAKSMNNANIDITNISSNSNNSQFSNNNAGNYNSDTRITSDLPLPLLLHDSLLTVVMSHSGPVVASAEIIRRMVWGWLRLEWEHIEVLGQPLNPQLIITTDVKNSSTMSDNTNTASASCTKIEMQKLSNNINNKGGGVFDRTSADTSNNTTTDQNTINNVNNEYGNNDDSKQPLLLQSEQKLQTLNSSSSSSSVIDIADEQRLLGDGPLEKMATDTWLPSSSLSSYSSSSKYYSISSLPLHTLYSDALIMLPLPTTLTQFSVQYLQLDITATQQTKARFLESCVFATIMLFILFIAAHVSFQ